MSDRALLRYSEGMEDILESEFRLHGSSHSGDRGEVRESVLVDVLNSHLPAVARAYRGGQVIDVRDVTSSQTDIVVYSAYAPRMGHAAKPLFLAEGVYAAVEQKSTLKLEMLRPIVKASQRLKQMRKVVHTGRDVQESNNTPMMTGIFAYKARVSASRIVKELESIATEFTIPNYQMPDFVCINGAFALIRAHMEHVVAYASNKPNMTLDQVRARLKYHALRSSFIHMLDAIVTHIQSHRPPFVMLNAYTSILFGDE